MGKREQYGNYRVSKDTVVGLVSEKPLTLDEIDALIKYLEIEKEMAKENTKEDHWLLELAKQRQHILKQVHPYTEVSP